MLNLNENILILNSQYLAIQVCTLKRAICLIYTDKAVVIDTSYTTYDWDNWLVESLTDDTLPDTDTIRSSNFIVKKFSVIKLTTIDYLPKKEVSFSRKSIYNRDDYACGYCNKQYSKHNLSYDHILPSSRGGKTTWENIITACKSCNTKKSDKTPEEAGMSLKKKPSKPKWTSYVDLPFDEITREYWKVFL